MLNSPKQSFKPDILELCDLRKDQPEDATASGILSFGWGNDQFLINADDSYEDFSNGFLNNESGLYRFQVPSVIKRLKVFIVGDGTSDFCSTVGEEFPDFCGITCPIDSECCSDLGICCYGSGSSVGCTGPVSAVYCRDTLNGNHYNGITTCAEAGPTFCTEGQHCCAPDPNSECEPCNKCYNCSSDLCSGKSCFSVGQICDCDDSGCGCTSCCFFDANGYPTDCGITVGCANPVADCSLCGSSCENGEAYGYCCQGDSGGNVSCSGSKVCESACGNGGKIVSSCDECNNDGMKYACFDVPGANKQCYGTWNGGQESCPADCDGSGGGGGGDPCTQCVGTVCQPCGYDAEGNCPPGCADTCKLGEPCTSGLISGTDSDFEYLYAVATGTRFPYEYFSDVTTTPSTLLYGMEGTDFCDICASTNRKGFIEQQEINCPASAPGAIELQYDLSNLCIDDLVEIEINASDNYLDVNVYITWDREPERNLIFNDRIPRGFTRYSVLGDYNCENCEFDIFCRLPRTKEGELMIQRFEFNPPLTQLDTPPTVRDRFNALRTRAKDPKETSPFQPAFAIDSQFQSSDGTPIPTSRRRIDCYITAISRHIKNDVYRVNESGVQIQVPDAKLGTPYTENALMQRFRLDTDTTGSNNIGNGIDGNYLGVFPATLSGEYGTPAECEETPGSGFIAIHGRNKFIDPWA